MLSCSLPNRRGKTHKKNKKSKSNRNTLEVNQKEILMWAYRWMAKGPRTLCYSTSDDAARAVDTSRTFEGGEETKRPLA